MNERMNRFLETLRERKLADGHLRGLLAIVVGGRIHHGGEVLSQGSTWRELAETLKAVRWDKEQVRELGLNPDDLPPRDRAKFWYTAISRAELTSTRAMDDADALAARLIQVGYTVSLPHAHSDTV